MSQKSEAATLDNLLAKISHLEQRLARIEALIDWNQVSEREKRAQAWAEQDEKEIGEHLENQIGLYWLAEIGAILLLIGTALFISYPVSGFSPLLKGVLSFLAVGGIFGLSRYWHASNPVLGQIFHSGALLLFYYAGLKLAFFSREPLIGAPAGLLLLVGILAIDFWSAVRKRKEILTALLFLFSYFTALLFDMPLVSLSAMVLLSVLAVWISLWRQWRILFLSTIIIAFAAHLVWLWNNPLMGHPFQAQAQHHYNLLFLVLVSAVFAGGQIYRGQHYFGPVSDSWLTAINASAVVLIGGLNVLLFFRDQVAILGTFTAAYFLLLAVACYLTGAKSYSNFLWACFSYVVISATIFASLKSPDFFIWLGLQSLLVIITAVWFRSRLLVLANIVIYCAIYLAYLILARSSDLANLSYAVTALASARILNWKKERLTLTTELMRNIYLVCAFFIILYGLSNAVPAGLISISWLGAALFYFFMSLLLKNKKYWWMAILTIGATVLRILLYDSARLEAGVRMLSFLVIGIVLVMLSIFSARQLKEKEKNSRAD
jgi:hypothetical protein